MSDFIIRPTGNIPLWQIEAVGEQLLRPEDQRELTSATGHDPGLALVEAVLASEKSWLMYGRKDMRLICIFGYSVEPSLKGICVWVAGTPALLDYRHEFTAITKIIRDNWLNKFGAIYNLIDLRNVAHIQWLIELGFELPPDQQVIMKDGTPFQYFIKEK
jgi:hypothetical protein